MKLNKNIFLACGAALLLTACSENSWNNGLDGFVVPTPGEAVETISYTLTADDYKAIASNATNVAIAESDNETEELAAIGTDGTFVNEEQAHKYLPALLKSSSFTYFTLDNGSSIKVTYNVATSVNPTVRSINKGVDTYTVSDANYKEAWGSTTDYIAAFSPSTPASAYIPGFLETKFNDAESGRFAIVSYNYSSVDPSFDKTPEPEKWTSTNVLGNVSLNQSLEVRGIVTAVCTRGFIVTDQGGSIMCYQSEGFNESAVSIDDLVTVKGTVSSYGTAYQISVTDASYTVDGEGEYEYPEPVNYTGAMIETACGRTADSQPEFITVTGEISISGNYYNVKVAGTESYDASLYMVPDKFKNVVEDGKRYTITGYFVSISGGSHLNIMVTGIAPAAASRSAKNGIVRRAANGSMTTGVVALYEFNGSAWTANTDAVVLQSADYTAMGQKYANLQDNGPATLIPIYLKQNYPYAVEGDEKIVVYAYYSGGTTTYRAGLYVLANGEWSINAGAVTEQFSKNDGNWQYNPSMIINLPSDKSDFCKNFYQTCVDWVYETQCVPLGDTSITSGKYWVTSYGNNEYWSGTSAYQTNVDIRPSAARNQYPEGFEGMSDSEVQEFIMTNLCTQTFPAALHILYPDAVPVEGIDVTYTINFGTYDGARNTETAVYKVTAPATFEYVSCTWFGEQP